MKSITYKQAYERLDNSGNLKRVAVSETLSNSLGYYELVYSSAVPIGLWCDGVPDVPHPFKRLYVFGEHDAQ